MSNLEKIVGVKELRENLADFITKVAQGNSFVVVRRSQPVFSINPVDHESMWEEVVDFTKIKRGGVKIEEILARL
ncbi:MAG: hypothetical protein A3J93_05540 [Candidatus Magasanikbacteria bacterium RIFOXYC2_FULL_42_28]|uniref:Antitoxin n=1 Tax=Candidatus Magasanikbacteria bacterium RIFOXYC2_FULL_42_28 TaxID=1798704 RepID=A0A1F6NW47_9BACT|nr:MAG: hypothetical protein A3J93_05540 [Candidatus Magasanikbacteria bacterium RIFOXYC2_FULL_42_28]